MPISHYYNGAARQQRKQKAPKVDRQVAKARRELQRERDRNFNAAIEDLLALIDSQVAKIKEEHGRSEVLIRTALGVGGPEFRGSSRKATIYNAWLKARMEEVNDERSCKGEEKLMLGQFKKLYGAEYKEIKDDEEKCNTYLNALEKAREEKSTSVRKYHRAAQLDINSAMKDMFGLALRLEERTGYLVSIFGHRGSVESNASPQAHVPQAMQDFLDTAIKKDVPGFLLHMEAWAVRGPEAVAKTSRTIYSDMRKAVVARLRNSLEKAAGRTPVRMYYSNFLRQVVIPNGVDLVGWPLKELIDPSRMNTYDLQSVHQGLTSSPPTIYFKKLTESELKEKRRLVATLKEKGEAKSKKRDHDEDDKDDKDSSQAESSNDGESSDSAAPTSNRGTINTEVVQGTKPPKSKKRRYHRSASIIDDTDDD
ncbi:hypothetical protein FRC02_003497 [Tulasnella sp. 418]|nr:hypothetical protein FRC02_003497 [Tulasnella sp. 418]